jgi:hypothetical protein
MTVAQAANVPDTSDKAILKLGVFTFKRKKTDQTFEALQLAVPTAKKLQRGKDKDKVVIVPNYKPFFELDEKTIRDFLAANNVDVRMALVLGGCKVLKIAASKGGMHDEIVMRLTKDNFASYEKDEKKRKTALAAMATTILSLYRDKNRKEKSKKWDLDFCYETCVSE